LKLSIVTINYNNKEGLEKTIASVANQKSDDNYEFEYIVIDGLSSDGSCELIKESSIITKHKIEKDNGIADAFNKGIQLANGEYLYFLNSGDIFYDDKSLQYIINTLYNYSVDIFIGKVAIIDEYGTTINLSNNNIKLKNQLYRNYLPHQGMFIKKYMFDKYGLYDIKYTLGMDYEWSLRFYKENIQLMQKDTIVAKMLIGGVSMTNYRSTFIAYHRARIKNKVLAPLLSYLISIFFITRRTLGNLYRKTRGLRF
jgi:glycosyltransferase involved in cell wall biosynthesis